MRYFVSLTPRPLSSGSDVLSLHHIDDWRRSDLGREVGYDLFCLQERNILKAQSFFGRHRLLYAIWWAVLFCVVAFLGGFFAAMLTDFIGAWTRVLYGVVFITLVWAFYESQR